MLEEGVADAVDIDRAMELGYRHPIGPLRSTDLVGLDVRLAIAEHLAGAGRAVHPAGPAARARSSRGRAGPQDRQGLLRLAVTQRGGGFASADWTTGNGGCCDHASGSPAGPSTEGLP